MTKSKTNSTNLVQMPLRGRPRKRQTLEERTVPAREAIFKAAGKVVGQVGYVDATIARITEAAGIAQGTFYLYFESRQSLFDELLPHFGESMLNVVREKTKGAKDVFDLEEKGFRAFFEFMADNPGFDRIMGEAEVIAPAAFEKHLSRVTKLYVNALRRAIQSSEIKEFEVSELESVADILMAARGYLYRRYMKSNVQGGKLPEHVVKTYMKLVTGGLR